MINLNYGDSDMLMKTQIMNKKKDETFILQPEDFNQVKEHPRNVDLYDPKVDYAQDNQDYQGLKEDIKNEFNKNKNEQIMNFFNKIDPLLRAYMKENSIDILLNNKNIIIGKDSLDITEKMINIINNSLKE